MFGAVRARLQGRADTEHEQALIRIAIGALTILYVLGARLVDGSFGPRAPALLLITGAFLVFSVGLFAALCLRPEVSITRRWAAIVADNLTISVFLHVGDGDGAPWYPVYLWVAFGNGFRYGRSYLLASTALSAAGFAMVVLTTDFWRANQPLAIGLLIGLLILPSYLASLLKRLMEARRIAEKASEAKSRFLANVSHEMRTPLNTVIGMTDLLLLSPLSPAQREMAELAQRSGRTLLSLINNVLDISKIEAGRMEEAPIDFDPADILATIRVIVGPQAAAKKLTLGTEIAPGTPRRLHGSAGHLQQVLLNLAANAVKFTERGGVRVRIEGRFDEPGRLSLLGEVVDTGIGIAPDLHQYIFTNFSQADETISRRFGGTGLGLAIAKQLVGVMGGRIGLESEPGRGSRFWFTVPMRVGTAPETIAGMPVPPPLPASGKRRSLSLLVADDNKPNQQVIQLMLEGGGHRVTLADNAEEALAAIAAAPFDLVLMDVNMPGMSGVEAARLHRTGPQRAVPIAALTADATPAMRQTCEEAGMVACITKPVDMLLLLREVDRLAGPRVSDPLAQAIA